MRPSVGVGIMLLKNDQVLLGKRNNDPAKADSELHGEGTWTLPGGKLEFKETLEECVHREVLEETGISIGDAKIISLSNDIAEDAHFITLGMLCKDFSGSASVQEPDIVEWKWFSLTSLPEPMFSPARKIIDNYMQKRLYKDGDR